YIISFVSRKEWRHADVGNFRLHGCYITRRIYELLPVRIACRTLFVIFTSLYLHFLRGRIDAVIAVDPFMTGVLAFIVAKLTGARLIIEVNGDYLNPASWNATATRYSVRIKLRYVRWIVPLMLNRADAVKLCHSTQLATFRGVREDVRQHVFHEFVPLA